MLPQDCANVNKLLRQMPSLGFTQHMLPQVCANVNIVILLISMNSIVKKMNEGKGIY